MATILVTTLDDVVDTGDGATSLREAIAAAAASAGADEIRFARAGTVALAAGELVVTQAGGPLAILGDLDGDGAADVTLDGGGLSRVLRVEGAAGDLAELTLAELVITGGRAVDGDGGGILATEAALELRGTTFRDNRVEIDGRGDDNAYAAYSGGAISLVGGSLRAAGSAFEGNRVDLEFVDGSDARGGAISADGAIVELLGTDFIGNGLSNYSIYGDGYGGAIFAVDSSIDVDLSTFADNMAYSADKARGGAMYTRGGSVAIRRSQLLDNAVHAEDVGSGGGIFCVGPSLILEGATVARNRVSCYEFAAGGGIVFGGGSLLAVNSTISGNIVSADYRPYGAAVSAGDITLRSSTVVANLAQEGYRPRQSGLYVSSASIENSIVQVVEFDGDRPVFSSNGGNVFGDPGDLAPEDVAGDTVADPRLGPLQDNGGPTLTHLPLDGSPAVDAGVATDAVDPDGAPLTTDQRGAGFPRVVGAAVDAGAVETGGGAAPVARDDAAATTRGRPVLVEPLANDTRAGGAAPAVVDGPATGRLVAVGGGLLYLPGPGEGDDSFTYRLEAPGGAASGVATVSLAVGPRAGETLRGGARDDRRAGTAGDDAVLGFAGDDALLGRGGDDLLLGGRGRDDLRGREGDDVLDGGGGRDRLRGDGGADLFVVDGPGGRAVVRDFDAGGGDTVVLTGAALLLADGRLDGGRVDAVDAGAALLLRADLDGDGTFEALLARIAGAAGTGLDDALANAIA